MFHLATPANKLQAQPAEFVTQVAEGKLILFIGRTNTNNFRIKPYKSLNRDSLPNFKSSAGIEMQPFL